MCSLELCLRAEDSTDMTTFEPEGGEARSRNEEEEEEDEEL